MNTTTAITLANTYLSNNNEYKDSTHDGIISGLKFICRIAKNEKIDTNQLTVQDNSSWLTGVVRTFTIQNRTKTIHYIKNIIDRSFEIVEIYLHSKDEQKVTMGKYILKDISGCQEGLRNLQYTYSSDRMFVCKLDSFIQRIKVNLFAYKDIDLTEIK